MLNRRENFSRALDVLAQPKNPPALPDGTERRRLEIPYITRSGRTDVRLLQLYLPKDATRPLPVVFSPHYGLAETSPYLHAYLKNGWAAACPTDCPADCNGRLTDDDLVFNNAALYTLRRLPELDRSRIALVGGSAGGYMALMLNALQLGICCVVANSPLSNIYFNMGRFYEEVKRVNRSYPDPEPLENAGPKPDHGFLNGMEDALIPIPGAVFGFFDQVLENFPDPLDTDRWEAFSPSTLTAQFGSPVLVTHFTSDILVPIDQTTRRFTYPVPGKTLPPDFDSRLPESLPGKLGRSLEDNLPPEQTRTFLVPAPGGETVAPLPYAAERRFNLCIFDEGPVESYGGHRDQPFFGMLDHTAYLAEMFRKTSEQTCVLTPEKLKALLLRLEGESVQLPVRDNADHAVYGSREVLRNEVCEELGDWRRIHGAAALDAVFHRMLEQETERNVRALLREAMDKIRNAGEQAAPSRA